MNNLGEISTPKNKCRHLGLRRTIERPKNHKTPQSDVKISYKCLQNNVESSPMQLAQCPTNNEGNHLPVSSSPSTPCLLQNKVKSAYTINTLPPRLSLNSRARVKYRKKKLEFSVTKTEAEPDTHYPVCSKAAAEAGTSNHLSKELTDSDRTIASHDKHQEKVSELKALIQIWKDGFKESLEELSSKIGPHMDKEEILAQLGIDPEMIEYT